MPRFSTEEIIQATGAKLLHGKVRNFSTISTDTRTIVQGSLFIALSGEHYNGNDFALEAVNKGATGLILTQEDVEISEEVTTFLVTDTSQALMKLACLHRQRCDIPVIAVTGSNGKTSTKDMISAVLSSKYHVLKTQANYNNEIGLSKTLFNISDVHHVAIVEMGMRGRGEIAALAKVALPTIGVVTNVGETHLELLGSIENIATAKAELVEAIPQNGLVVLNADNKYVKSMASKAKSQVITFGIENQADVQAVDLFFDEAKTTFHCCYRNQDFIVSVPAIGIHNVYNALAAIAVGLHLGLTEEQIRIGLSSFQPGEMRLHIKKIGQYIFIDDAYNASPMSMKAAIDSMRHIAKGRMVAVLGDMLELGHVSESAHQEIGTYLANANVQVVVTVGKLARLIAESAKVSGIKVVKACMSHDEAQMFLTEFLQPGDTVLIKGSRGMHMEKILDVF